MVYRCEDTYAPKNIHSELVIKSTDFIKCIKYTKTQTNVYSQFTHRHTLTHTPTHAYAYMSDDVRGHPFQMSVTVAVRRYLYKLSFSQLFRY